MAQITRASHKDRFQTGDIPTQADYINLIDSFAILTNDHNSGSLILTGSLNVSGGGISTAKDSPITAQGGLIAIAEGTALTVLGSSYLGGTVQVLNHLTSSQNISGSATGTLTFGIIDGDSFTNILSNTHITSSGNISASGTVIADNFTSDGGDVGGISFTDGVNITGNITASGDLSSSATIRSNTGSFRHMVIDWGSSITAKGQNLGGGLEADEYVFRNFQGIGTGYIFGTKHSTNVETYDGSGASGTKCPPTTIEGRFIKLESSHSTAIDNAVIDDQTIYIDSGENIEMDAFTGLYTFKHNSNNPITFNKGNITASGDISASGDILANEYYVNNKAAFEAGTYTLMIGDDTNWTNFTYGPMGSTTSHFFNGHITGSNITANGNISASGNLITNNISASGEIEGRYRRPIITKSSDGTLVLNDQGSYLRCSSVKLTIPLNSSVAYPIGTEIDFIQTTSAGHLMVTASNGVIINSRHNLLSASGQFSAISCKKVGTDEWDMLGDLTK